MNQSAAASLDEGFEETLTLHRLGVFPLVRCPQYEEAVKDLKALRQELAGVNQSAAASLDEGFEETLTLHRLGVFPLVRCPQLRYHFLC